MPARTVVIERIGALVRRLRVRHLGTAERSAGTKRQSQTTGELRGAIGDQRGFRRAESRCARLHGDRCGEGAEEHRRARPNQLGERCARQHFRQDLRQRTGHRNRAHCTGQNEGRDDAGLIVAGIDLGRAQHGFIENHRRVGVDQIDDNAILVDEIGTEQDPAHVDCVLRPLGCGDRPHEGLVRQAHMGMHHVEVALVDRDVHRLADRAARVVHGRREIGHFDEILEVLNGRVAPLALPVADEGRPVDRSKDRRLAADLHGTLGIARVLGEDGRCGLQQRPAKPLGKMHPLTADIGTGVAPQLQRLLVVTKLDTNLFEHPVGIRFNQRQAFFVEHLVFADLAGDVDVLRPRPAAASRRSAGGCTACAAASAATAGPTGPVTFDFHLNNLLRAAPRSLADPHRIWTVIDPRPPADGHISSKRQAVTLWRHPITASPQEPPSLFRLARVVLKSPKAADSSISLASVTIYMVQRRINRPHRGNADVRRR